MTAQAIIDLLNTTYHGMHKFRLLDAKDRAIAEFLAALMAKLSVTLP